MDLQCTYEINPNCADVAVQIWIILITEGKLSETLTLSFKDDALVMVIKAVRRVITALRLSE